MPTVGAIRIEGAEELQKLLRSLTPKLEKKVLRQALRKAGKPVLGQAKSTAPVKSGLLRQKLTLRALKMKRRYMVGVKVTGTQAAPHAHLVESGTQLRRQKKTGRSTGKVEGIHFLEKALEGKQGEVIAIVSKEIKAGVERERAKGGS